MLTSHESPDYGCESRRGAKEEVGCFRSHAGEGFRARLELGHGAVFQIIAAENAGQGLVGEAAGEVEAVLGPKFGCEFLAALQGDGDVAILLVGVKQAVFRKETGEEQAVPMLISRIGCEVVDFLPAAAFIELVAKRPAASAQAVAELALLDGHVAAVVLLMDGQVLQCGATGSLSRGAGLEGDA